jgi:hypothetical protein
VEIVPSKDSLMLRINFVNVPTTLDAQRTWTFGLLATPSRPLSNEPPQQNIETIFGQPNEAIGSPAIGVTYADIPLGDDPLEYHLSVQEQARAANAVRLTHGEKRLAVPWLQGMVVGAMPGYVEDLPHWMYRPALATDGGYVFNCQGNEEWRDLLVYAIVRVTKKYGFDGVYFDTGQSSYGCKNPLHGCGYFDARGRWQASYPIFAQREFKKRLYRALYEAMGREPYIMTFVNGLYDLPNLTFDTAIGSGEELHAAGAANDYRTLFKSLSRWEAQFNPTQWGNWPVFMPSGASKGDLPVTNSFLTFALLERTPLWIAACDQSRVFAALEAIQKLGPETRFIPRWDSTKYVRVSSKDCPAAVYAAGKQAVIVVSNFGNSAVQTTVDCDTQALGWNAVTLQASEAITGAALNVSGNQVAATVPPNSFLMIRASPIPQRATP